MKKLQDFKGAISDFTKSIELDPKNAEAYYNRAKVKVKLKDDEGAIADYTKSIRLRITQERFKLTKTVD